VSSTHSAVIFDMDGLLVDSEPLYMRAWQEAASQLGFEITDDHYFSLLGLPERDYEAAVLDALGGRFPMEKFRACWKQLWLKSVSDGELRPKAGAVQLVAALRAARVPITIATSSPRERATLSLRSASLDSFFHHIVVSEDVAHGKPAPDAFLLAASRLGIPSSECLVLEDSVTGAEAGLAAGMSVVLVPDLADPPAEYIERVLLVAASLDEATPHVLRAVRAA
jgi:HAD superfamily hydrolase (TIGR01509 family)